MAGKLNLDPQTIVDKEFDVDFKGYNPDQVDHMLDQVIQDYQTYESMLSDYSRRLQDLERTNASLRAKLIEVEGRVRASQDADPMLSGSGNVDILKRLSRLEQKVFDENGKR
ncbi:MAG: DivIVA domain-containing protein [Bulleidia sp.]